MSSTYALDIIIEEVVKKDHNNTEWKRKIEDKQLVVVDVKNMVVLPRIPKFNPIKVVKTYLVDPEQIVEVSGIEVSVRDFEKDQNIKLDISYQALLAESEPGKPKSYETLALVTAKEVNSEIAVRKKLEHWIKKFSLSKPNFLSEFNHILPELKQNIEKQAKEKLGLNLKPKIRIKVDDLPIESYENETLRVFTADSGEKILLTYNAEIYVFPKDHKKYSLAVAKLEAKSERKEIIERSIKKIMLEEKIQHVFDNRIRETICNKITQRVNIALENHGREVIKLQIKVHDDDILITNRDEEISFPYSHKIEEYPDPILIQTRVNMKLVDLGKLRNSEITIIRDWVEEKLISLIKSKLFFATYIDLVLKFNDYQKSIIDEYKREAELMGYQVQMLIVKPQLPEIEYAEEGFQIITQEKDYATKDPDIPVRIQAIINGRISNLNEIKNLINAKVDLKDRIIKMAEKEISNLVHQKAPSEAILEFSEVIERPVSEEISAILREKFAIDDFSLSVTIKQADNKLRKRFKDLSKGINSFNIQIKPKYEAGKSEVFDYILTYKIRGVHPSFWYVFQNNERSSIEEELADVESIFSEVVKSILEIKPDDVRKALENGITKVFESTGLLVEPVSFRSESTIAAETGRKVYQEKMEARQLIELESFKDQLNQKREQINQLEKKLALILKDEEADQEEIDTLKERIEKLNQELNLPFDSTPAENLLPPSADLDIDTGSLLDNIIGPNKRLKGNGSAS